MTTGPARALLRRLSQYLDDFSACFSRQPQREAASQYIDGLSNDSERKSSSGSTAGRWARSAIAKSRCAITGVVVDADYGRSQ